MAVAEELREGDNAQWWIMVVVHLSKDAIVPRFTPECHGMPKSSHVVRTLVDADAEQTGGRGGRGGQGCSKNKTRIPKTYVKVDL